MDILKRVFTGEIKEINEKDRTLVSLVSTASVDRMGDIIDQDGIDLKNYRKNPIVLWAHDYSQLPIGKSLWIKKQDGALVSKMQFASTAFAQEVFQLYKEGFLKAFSIGFVPKEYEPIDESKPYGPRRFLKSEMLEYSAVPVPANPEALAMAMQKGILKTASLITSMTPSDVEKEEENEKCDEIEIEKESQKEGEIIEGALDEIMAENKLMAEEINGLKNENNELRYKVFTLLREKKQKLSEMTVDNLAEKFGEIAIGVIRKAQGKLD